MRSDPWDQDACGRPKCSTCIQEYNRCLIPEITTRIGQKVAEDKEITKDTICGQLKNTSKTKRGREEEDSTNDEKDDKTEHAEKTKDMNEKDNDKDKEDEKKKTQKKKKTMVNRNLQSMINKLKIRKKLAQYKFTPQFTNTHTNPNLQNLHIKFNQFQNVTFAVKAPLVDIVDIVDDKHEGVDKPITINNHHHFSEIKVKETRDAQDNVEHLIMNDGSVQLLPYSDQITLEEAAQIPLPPPPKGGGWRAW